MGSSSSRRRQMCQHLPCDASRPAVPGRRDATRVVACPEGSSHVSRHHRDRRRRSNGFRSLLARARRDRRPDGPRPGRRHQRDGRRGRRSQPDRGVQQPLQRRPEGVPLRRADASLYWATHSNESVGTASAGWETKRLAGLVREVVVVNHPNGTVWAFTYGTMQTAIDAWQLVDRDGDRRLGRSMPIAVRLLPRRAARCPVPHRPSCHAPGECAVGGRRLPGDPAVLRPR